MTETTCRLCGKSTADYPTLRLCEGCKHDNEIEAGDPDWQHEHRPTGEIRQCLEPSCRTSWQVSCHNGRRRHCELHGAAVKRRRDRERIAEKRELQRDSESEIRDFFIAPLSEAIERATGYRDAGMSYLEAKRALRAWNDALLDDLMDEYPEDASSCD